jgi:fused signal recognition particle receptor
MTPEEIARANAEFNAIIVRCNNQAAELKADRLRQLAAIPEAAAALQAHDQATTAAERARVVSEEAAAQTLASAEQKAEQDERKAKDQADQDVQDVRPEVDRQAAIAAADATYNQRLNEIDRTLEPGESKTADRNKARTDHDAAVVKAESDYRKALDTALETQQRVYVAAQEKHIADEQTARRQEQLDRDRAAAAFAAASKTAEDNLQAAIDRIPQAHAIDTDTAAKLQALSVQCAKEKAEVLKRLSQIP